VGLLLCALSAGCLRDPPARYAPVWAPDGRALTHVARTADGKVILRRIDLVTGQAGELAHASLQGEPVALVPAPGGERVACLVHLARKGGRSVLRLHVVGREGVGSRLVWQQASPKGTGDVAWSSDGQAVAIAADGAGGGALWHVPVRGGSARRLAEGLADVRGPTVAPDGRRIAVLACPNGRTPWGLYVVSVGDGTARAVVPGLFESIALGYRPAWEPGGERVAYVAERGLTAGMAEIWLWDARTGRRRRVARTEAGAFFSPTWSPRAPLLACVRRRVGLGQGIECRTTDIAVVDVSRRESEPQVLAADGRTNLSPAWAPDGRRLAFNTCADTEGLHVVRIVGLDGAPPRLAAQAAWPRFLLAWSRHGTERTAWLGQAEKRASELPTGPERAWAFLAMARDAADVAAWELAARRAEEAAKAASGPVRVAALDLLARARMRLGRPEHALKAAQRRRAARDDPESQALCERLECGLDTVRQAVAVEDASAEDLLHLARAYGEDLGQPRRAADLAFRLLAQFPKSPQAPAAAKRVFACCEDLGADAACHRLLERAADRLGRERLTPSERLLLAEAAVASGQAARGIEWLEPVEQHGASDAALAERVARVCLLAGEQLLAQGNTEHGLAAWRQAAALAQARPQAAQASLRLGEWLMEHGRHTEAAHHLLGALRPEATETTLRGALRALTVARLRHRDRPAYDAARVGQLVRFGFLEEAVAAGDLALSGLLAEDPAANAVRDELTAAFDRWTAALLAAGDVREARKAVDRWLRRASPDGDLPQALQKLAACQRRAGHREAWVTTLSRLAIEFADRPEGAAARRELQRLNAPPPR
jgi:Tol biopolymer transport system component/tetratricopeptide (TPR) repeat protein